MLRNFIGWDTTVPGKGPSQILPWEVESLREGERRKRGGSTILADARKIGGGKGAQQHVMNLMYGISRRAVGRYRFIGENRLH